MITKDRRLGEYLAMYIADFSDQMNLLRKRIEMVQCNHESRKANKPNISFQVLRETQTNKEERRLTE